MGSATGKHLETGSAPGSGNARKAIAVRRGTRARHAAQRCMSLLLLVALVLGLNPAAALAQTKAPTDPQGNASTYVAGARGSEGGSGSAGESGSSSTGEGTGTAANADAGTGTAANANAGTSTAANADAGTGTAAGNAASGLADTGSADGAAAESGQTPEEKRQEELDNSVQQGAHAPQGTQATTAESTISMMTYASFRYTKLIIPAECLNKDSLAGQDLTASFEGGTPYANSGSTANGAAGSNAYYYKAHFSWTASGKDAQGKDWTATGTLNDRVYGFPTLTTDPTIALPTGDIYAQTPLPNNVDDARYVVTVQLEGSNGMKTIPAEFPTFTITKSEFTIYEVVSPQGAEGADVDARMTGLFASATKLEYADLMADSLSAPAKGTLAALQDLIRPQQMLAAAQLDLTNEELPSDKATYGSITNIELKVPTDAAQQMIDKGAFTVGAVAGETAAVTYGLNPSSGQTGPVYTFSPVGEGADGTLVATVTMADGYATVNFPAKGLTTKPGAFAIAIPVDASQQFTVQASVTNGTMTNVGTAQYAQGSAVEFVLSPFEGYVIDEAHITVTGAGANNWELVGGNTLRLKDTSALTGTIVVQVDFQPYVNPDPDQTGFSVSASGVNDAGTAWADLSHGWVRIEGTGKDGKPVSKDKREAQPSLADLKAGTAVKLTFNADENYVVKNAWVVSGDTASSSLAGVKDGQGSIQPISLTGNEHMISALAEDTRVVVQFTGGNPPATDSVTYRINGVSANADQGQVETVTGAVMGTNPTVAITAQAEYVIGDVRLYAGAFTTVDDAEASGAGTLIAAAADKRTYTLTVPNISRDYTVVAKFRKAPMQIQVSTTESGVGIVGGSFSVQGATHAGGTTYNVEPDANVTFTATADAGYRFTGVWVDGSLIAQKDLAGTTQAGGTFSVAFGKGATIVPEFTAEQLPGPAENLVSVVVSTDGNGQVSPAGASFERGGSLTLNFMAQGTFRTDCITVSDGANTTTVALDGAASWKFDPADPALASAGVAADAGSYSLYVQFKDVPDQPQPTVQYSDITLAAVGQGSISPQGTPTDSGEYVYTVVSGAEQRLTMIPAEGYTLAGVYFAEAGQELTLVTATQTGAGSAAGTGSTAATPYLSGNTLVFTPQKNAGQGTAGKSYAVMVQFKKADDTAKRYTVVGQVDGGHGTMSPLGTSQQLAGAALEFSFMPDKGYKLGSVLLTTAAGTDFNAAGAKTTEVASLVAAGKLPLTLSANTRVVAKFVPVTEDDKKDPTDPNNPDNPDNPANQPRITVSPQVSTGGLVAPDTDQTMLATSELSLSFSPYKGYTLQDVTLACAELSNAAELNRTVQTSVMTPNGTGSYSWSLKLDASTVEKLKGISGTVTVKVTANFKREITAYPISVFTQGPGQGAPQVTSKAAAYGYVSPGFDTQGMVDVQAGGTGSFTFIEQPGYVVSEVYVGTPGADGLPTAEQRVAGAVTAYDLVGVTGAKTLRVVYTANEASGGTTDVLHTVTASPAKGASGAHGYLSPWGQTEVKQGASLTLIAQPDEGYKLGTLRVSGPNGAGTVFDAADPDTFGAMNGSAYTLADIAADYTVTATFVVDDEAKEPGDNDPVNPKPDQHEDQTIFVSVVGPGTVTPGNATAASPVQVKVPYNGRQTFSFIPDAAPEDDPNVVNRLAKIVVKRNGGLLTNEITNVGAGYTFQNVTADIELQAVFEQVRKDDPGYDPKPVYRTHELTAQEVVGQGSITPEGTTLVNEGASLTYTMKAADGWHLSYIAVDRAAGSTGITVPASNLANGQYTFANVDGPHSIQAVFVKDAAAGEDPADEAFTTFQVQADPAKVLASPSGAFSVKQGDTASLTLSPTHGNTITSVRVVDAADPSRVLATFSIPGGSTSGPYTVNLPCYPAATRALVQVSTGNASTGTVKGPFYNVTASVAADAHGNKLGSISPSGTQSVKAGSTVSYTLTPADGCMVDSVKVNGAPAHVKQDGGFYTITLHEVNGAMNIVAQFRQLTQQEIEDGTIPQPGTPCTVTIASQGAGTVEPVGVQKVAPGLALPLTLKPTGDARLGTLVIDGVDVTSQVQRGSLDTQGTRPVYTYTIDPVRADMQVTATFVNPDGSVESTDNQIPVNVEVKVDVRVSGNVYGGCVEPGDPFTVNPGDSQTFKIKPANGFYVDQVYREEGGKITQLQVRDWKPNYTTATRAGQAGSQGASVQVASAQVTDVAQVNPVGALLGVEQAWAAATVQKPYSAVDVNDIRTSFTLNVVLKKCSENGLDEYVYDDAAAAEPNTKPNVSGNGTVRPSDGIDTPDEDGNKTYIIEPGLNANGELEDLESITIHGVRIDLTGDDLKTNGKQDPLKVEAYVNSFRGPDGNLVLLPGESFKWVPTPEPGHYELTLRVQQAVDENGNPVVDENGNPVFKFDVPSVDFTGAGKAYSHEVRLVAKVVDANGKPIEGGGILAQREDGTQAKNGVLYMDYGGHFDFNVQLPEGEYELVGCDLDGGLSFTERSTEDSQVMALSADDEAGAPLVLADGGSAPSRVFVYGPGTITANIRAVADASQTYTVTASAGKGGQINPAGTTSYTVGRDAQYTFAPESSAYVLDTVKVDGQVLKDWKQHSYTFTGCKAGSEHTIEVTFKATPSQVDPGNPNPNPNDPTALAKRALKSLQSLATTGDNGYAMVLGLCAVACAGLGLAIIATGRNRRKMKAAVEGLQNEEE